LLYKNILMAEENYIELNLDSGNNDVLLDLNFYYKRIDNIMTYINDLKAKLNVKYNDLTSMLNAVEAHLNSESCENDNIQVIEEDVDTLDDLIYVAKKYGTPNKINIYNIDTSILYNIVKPLEQLKQVVGLNNIKDQIIDQIITSIMGIYDDDLMFHTVITGPPGVGKTMIAKILGELYLKMGILKSKSDSLVFNIAKRSDLIGKYLGHTAIKTQDFIDKCVGGVMFIDEVYSLGNIEQRDSFAKECIDTINLNLTEKKNFICIIAGYEKEINDCFFSYNPGLNRRFPFRYKIEKYSSDDLVNIFIEKIKNSSWKLDDKIDNDWLNKKILDNILYFNNYGGDIDNLILKIKIVHGRRIFGKHKDLKKIITKSDIEKGIQKLILSKENTNKNTPPFMMYI